MSAISLAQSSSLESCLCFSIHVCRPKDGCQQRLAHPTWCDAWVLVHKLPYSCAFSRAVLLSLQLSLHIKETSTEGPQQVSLLFCAARHYPNNSASKSEGGGCKQASLDCVYVSESHRLECGQFVPAHARHSSKCWHAGLARGPSAPLHRCPRGLHGSSWPEGVRE